MLLELNKRAIDLIIKAHNNHMLVLDVLLISVIGKNILETLPLSAAMKH